LENPFTPKETLNLLLQKMSRSQRRSLQRMKRRRRKKRRRKIDNAIC
jgi:hypothetical protein